MKPARLASRAAIAAVLTTGVLAAAGGAHASRHADAVAISCVGDTLSGHATVSATHGTHVRLSLHAGGGAASLSTTKQVQRLTVPKGRDAYSFSFNVASLGSSYYMVRAYHGAKQVDSPVLSALACSPGAVVPEAPAAVLLPLSALATIGIAFGVATLRRRRSAAQPA